MNDLLYCIIRMHQQQDAPLFEEGHFKLIHYRNIAAVSLQVAEDVVPPIEVQEAIAYVKMVQSLLESPAVSSVIPLKYGALFHSTQSVEQMLAEEFETFDLLLTKFEGLVEMTIRQTAPLDLILEDAQEMAPIEPSSGRAYLESVSRRLAEETKIPDAIIQWSNALALFFEGLFSTYKPEYPRAKSKKEQAPLLPAVHFLIKKTDIEKFKLRYEELPPEKKRQIGLSGPWFAC